MKARKGITLIELLITISIIAIIGVVLIGLIRIPINAHQFSEKEFSVQSDLRSSSEMVNNSVRNATAAFLLTKKDHNFTPEWNYLISETEGEFSRVILYQWNGTNHTRRVLAEASSDRLIYSIDFNTSDNGQLLNYAIMATDLKTGRKDDVTSKVKPLNSFNIIDNSKMDYSYSPPKKSANCLAFRSDKPEINVDGEKGYHHVSVSFVLDTSGSMRWNINNTNNATTFERINTLKKQLNDFLDKIKADDKVGVVDVRLYPFSRNAFYLNPNFDNGGIYGGFHNVLSANQNTLHQMVNSLYAEHGTNVGDGIRHAYYGIENYEKEKRAVPDGEKKRIKHYLFVLTDGVPTFCSYIKKPSHAPSGWTSNEDTEEVKIKSDKGYLVLSEHPTYKVFYNGGGNVVSPNQVELRYIEKLGKRVKEYKTKNPKPENIEVTVVGFSGKAGDKENSNDIGKYLGASPNKDGNYYEDCDSADSLQATFEAFTKSILDVAGLWYIAGPQ